MQNCDDQLREELKLIVTFLRSIGILVQPGSVRNSFLPGVTIQSGGLVYDLSRLTWPGDLLHEAGHIAVTEEALRSTLNDIAPDPGQEMAAIAWSYAAALACGYDAAKVFHAGGYGAGGQWIADVFADGGTLGQPMLHWYGMTIYGETATVDPARHYPNMIRWLR